MSRYREYGIHRYEPELEPELDDDMAEFTGQPYQSWPGLPERGERRFPLGRLLILAGLLAAPCVVGVGVVVGALYLLA